MNEVIVTSSWDDGHPLDIKLSSLLQKYELPATFYIPVKNREGRRTMGGSDIKKVSENFDIGGHTLNHSYLTDMGLKSAEQEVLSGKDELERIIGKEIRVFCYPGGQFNDDIVRIVKGAGFIGARTVRLLENDMPDPYRMGTTVHATEKGLTHLTNYFIKSKIFPNKKMVFRYILKGGFFRDWKSASDICLEHILTNGGIFHIWGHSWEIELFRDWEKLASVFKRLNEIRDSYDVKYMDNAELVSYFNR